MPRFFICLLFQRGAQPGRIPSRQELSAMCCRDREAGQAWT
jgi:hypothetical protein